MNAILGTLRQWCKTCQRATTSRPCGICPGTCVVCAECGAGCTGQLQFDDC